MRNDSDRRFRENQSTHFMFNHFFRKIRAVYEITQKYGRARQATMTIRRMRFACRITKARLQMHTHSIEYLLLFHGNSCYANAPQCYVIHSFPLLLNTVQTNLAAVEDVPLLATSSGKFVKSNRDSSVDIVSRLPTGQRRSH